MLKMQDTPKLRDVMKSIDYGTLSTPLGNVFLFVGWFCYPADACFRIFAFLINDADFAPFDARTHTYI